MIVWFHDKNWKFCAQLQHPDPQFLGAHSLVAAEIFYVLYISETCYIWALAAAEQQQKCISLNLLILKYGSAGEAKKRHTAVTVSVRSVRARILAQRPGSH